MSKNKENTINVFYASIVRILTVEEWENKLRCLPERLQSRVMRYKRWQDRQAKMFGCLLLEEGLRNFGFTLKCDIHKDSFGRPYINEGIDFNVSDSDGCVVCALTSQGRLGIDIEKIKPIDLEDFKECMRPEQWRQIEESKNKYKTFYDIWTIKESTLKADGRGLSFPLDKVRICGNKVILDGKSWFLTKMDIGRDYSCHLACDMKAKQINIKEIHFNE